MLFLHRHLLFGDSHLPSFDTSRMQVTPTSNSRAISYEANNMDNDIHTTRNRKSIFSHISAFHEICWHHTGASSYLGMPIHQYFQRHARNTQQCTARLSRTTRDRKYLPTIHSISGRLAGTIKVKPMSRLPYIVASVTSPSTDGHVFVSLF